MGHITGVTNSAEFIVGRYAGWSRCTNSTYRIKLEQANWLALDRFDEDSISEVFEEPMVYKPVGLFDVDMKEFTEMAGRNNGLRLLEI